ncbi:site-specific integrase [Streptomyces sp. M10(2022)]
MLEHASAAATDTPFTHGGRTYRRVLTEEDRTLARGGHRTPVRVRDDTGQLVHVEAEEESAFWDWATVETLRHSGARIEEMCEVSHLSIRHYQRNNGEMIALLVISPSKTDRERVIPMSAELFHVIASVIRRHTRDGSPVPILRRFDPHDKVWSPPMPFLFQRKIGSTRSVISPVTVLNMLARRCADLAEHHPVFRSVKFTPHDFRRIFTTELVNSGLPIHIGATLLGHLNIQTTRATSPCSTKTSFAIISPTSTNAASFAPTTNTATPPATSGTSSKSTSINEKWNLAHAGAPMAPLASMNMPASVVPCFGSTRKCSVDSTTSKPTSSPEEAAPWSRAGRAKLKGSTSLSSSCARNGKTAGADRFALSSTSAYPAFERRRKVSEERAFTKRLRVPRILVKRTNN